MRSIICTAIRERRLIEFYYDHGPRLVEPHAYGHSKEGNALLRAYQVSGASESHQRVGWKLFRVDEISRLNVLPETFSGPRQGYRRGDEAMENIACQL